MVTEVRARRSFRPRFWPSVALLLVLPVLISLGLWQLDRARQKVEIRDLYIARSAEPALVLGAREVRDEDRFRRVQGTGEYAARFGFLLDNQVYKGRPGYHVFTPFKPGRGQQWILIDRGWVPWGPDRDRLPEIEVPNGDVKVSGQLRAPGRPGLMLGGGEVTDTKEEMPLRWQSVDLRRYARITGLSIAPLLLQLDADNEHGYVRDWPVYSDSWIDRHKGYAFQWFALAVTLVFIYVMLNFKRTDDNGANSE